MGGNIRLRIDRSPDFFALTRERGDFITFVAESEGRIIGTLTSVLQRCIFNAEEVPFNYICDLKVHPEHRNGIVAHRLLSVLREHLLATDVDLLLLTSAHGNAAATTLTGGRAGLPLFSALADFRIAMMIPKRFNDRRTDFCAHGTDEIAAFHSHSAARYAFDAPIGLSVRDPQVIVRSENRVIAAASLIDPGRMKQDVVVGLPLATRTALAGWRLIGPLFNLASPMRLHQPIRTLYIQQLDGEAGHEGALTEILRRIRTHAYEEGYHFVGVAYDERDTFMHRLIAPHTFSTFRSHAWLASLRDRMVPSLSPGGSCRLDYSLA